ncbi:serine/threonine-protein kinase [Stigmatella aurantiaca]|uniref:Protein kinase n=1 Tax=Stigmatella aurantiaca (strain DW4/3-1) TaxID=378806 RepID=Q08VS6_STIAD|nr:serine/threonine-protein kinase [Stigmatella aurantiaca]ADO74475.1 Protein kinase [Stigmatella aurantiaca DW4/3-1]EAU64589.1 protein kinase [Stigmatella aurantiaca DW4/3-1]
METLPLEPVSLLLGTQVGSWRVVGRGGYGSYGMVYRVEQVDHAAAGSFALKLALRPEDPRFEREGELLSRVSHPHVPRLYGQGTWMSPSGAAFPYVVMEWVPGVTLYDWAARPPFSSLQALRLLAQVARALEATHAVGGVHRDVKGNNVLVTSEGARALLMDFGSGCYPGAKRLTWQSGPPGTFQYWSPEALRFQWRFRFQSDAHYEAGPADDVYALGMMVYRLVTGRYPPPLSPEALEAPPGQMPSQARPEKVARVSPELAALIRRMLSEVPSERGSAAEMAQALDHAAETAGRRASRPIAPRKRRGAPVRAAWLGRWRTGVAWLGWGMAVSLGVLQVANEWPGEDGGGGERVEVEQPSVQPTWDAEDGGTAGLAQAALQSAEKAEAPEAERGGISREMPKGPFAGQRKPPCKSYEVEVNGGCWLALQDKRPPCGDETFVWKGRCYWPSVRPPRPETSGWP